MKVMYCITRSAWGGAQKHVYELIKDQLSRNNNVYLVIGDCGELYDRVKQLPVTVFILKDMKREISFGRDLKAIGRLRKILVEVKPDILHLHSSKAGTIGRLAALHLSCRVIYTVHGWSFTNKNISFLKRLFLISIEKVMALITDKIICVSKYDLESAYDKKILAQRSTKGIVVYNGAYSPKDAHVRSISKGATIVFTMVARLDNQKNQSLLLKAIASEGIKLRLNLVGSGENLENLEKLVKKLDLEDSVKFLGFQKNVQKILEKSDYFILISNYEGLPISIIEAMGMGLPIIASDVGGVKELVKQNGFLVTNNINDIGNTIRRACEDAKNYSVMSRKSLELYSKKFNISDMLESNNNIYQSMVQSKIR